ncbi:MAG: response regulator [Anaerolineae bacterium]
MSGNILVVDDDIALAKTVEAILRQAGHAAVLAHTAEDGVRLALNDQPDLVLLDVMVPNMGGWEACRRVREQSDVPIIRRNCIASALICGYHTTSGSILNIGVAASISTTRSSSKA